MPRNKKRGKGNGMPYNTGIPAKKQVNRLIKFYIKGSYKPTLRELNNQYRGSEQRQQKEIPAWFEAYRQSLDAERGKTNAAYDKGVNRIGNFSQTSEAADGARRAQVAEILAKDKGLRGANTDIAGVDAEAAGASGNRIAMGGNMMGLLENRRDIQDQYMGRRKAITMDQQQRALEAERVRQSKIAADRRDTRDKMRGDVLKYLMDSRNLNNQFFLDRASLAETKRSNNLDYSASIYDSNMSGSKGGNSGSDTIRTVGAGVSFLRNNFDNKNTISRTVMIDKLVADYNFSKPVAKRAVARYLKYRRNKEANKNNPMPGGSVPGGGPPR